MPKLLEIIFGCRHQFAFPIRPEGHEMAYQVCTVCGAQYEYDWNAMRRLRPIVLQPAPIRASTAPKVA